MGQTPLRSGRFLASVGLFLLATQSKEIALVFPGILLAHQVAAQALPARRRASALAPYLIVAGLYLVARTAALGGFQPVHRFTELSGTQLALSAAGLFPRYLLILAAPLDLSVFHSFRPVSAFLDPHALLGLASLAAFAGLGLLLWRTSRILVVAWAILFLPLVPVLYIRAVGESPFAERYLYLPSAGFAVLVAWAVGAAWRARPAGRRLVAVLATALVLAQAVAAVAAQGTWHDDVSLWTNAAAKAPGDPTPHYNLAAALLSAGRPREALPEFQEAHRIQPSAAALTGVGAALLAAGEPERATVPLREALLLEPRSAQALGFLGASLLDLRQYAAAAEALRAAVALQPGDPDLHRSLAAAYEGLGDHAAAAASLATALRLAPTSAPP